MEIQNYRYFFIIIIIMRFVGMADEMSLKLLMRVDGTLAQPSPTSHHYHPLFDFVCMQHHVTFAICSAIRRINI